MNAEQSGSPWGLFRARGFHSHHLTGEKGALSWLLASRGWQMVVFAHGKGVALGKGYFFLNKWDYK